MERQRTMARCREATPPRAQRLGKAAGRWAGDDVFPAERYFNGDDALWCSSSSFSSAFRTAAHEHGRSVAATATAATSSSEASWNSRSALLPDGKVVSVAMAPAPSMEAEQSGIGGERRRGKPPPPPSSHLRRWILGVAGCACVGGGDGEDSVSGDDDGGECRDEVEDDNVVGVGGQKELVTDEAGELFERRGESEELVGEEAIAVRVKPGRWLDDGDEFLAEKAAFSPVQPAPCRAAISGGFSTPFFNPATTTAVLHKQRRNSSEVPGPLGDNRSALVSTKQCSAFRIVAGNTARGGALHAAAAASKGNTAAPCISRCDTSSENDAAPSELGCAYPPSEASVVWSVVTADGVASCNFSSAASGYYHHHINGGEDDAGRRNRRRRSGIANSGGLLTCMGDKAVDAVGAAAVGARHGGRNSART